MYFEVEDIIKNYIGADTNKDTVIYLKNATLGINIFADILTQIDEDQVVLTTKMEHNANYLPYAARLNAVLIDILPDGNIDLEDYKNKLELYGGKVKFVCVTGASNTTGIVPPFYTMARLAHQYGAKIFLKDSPARYEAGYPNIVGTIVMGTALKLISRMGISNIEKIESSLYKHLLDGLKQILNIILYGTEANAPHIPFISFNFKGIHHSTISQILGYDYGIEIASGKNAADIYTNASWSH